MSRRRGARLASLAQGLIQVLRSSTVLVDTCRPERHVMLSAISAGQKEVRREDHVRVQYFWGGTLYFEKERYR